MAIKFEKIQAGMKLYDRHTHRMGHTTLRTLGEWPVSVKEVDAVKRRAFVSWNGNAPGWWYERSLRRLYTWSMYDPGVEVKRGLCDKVISVKRVKTTKEG